MLGSGVFCVTLACMQPTSNAWHVPPTRGSVVPTQLKALHTHAQILLLPVPAHGSNTSHHVTWVSHGPCCIIPYAVTSTQRAAVTREWMLPCEHWQVCTGTGPVLALRRVVLGLLAPVSCFWSGKLRAHARELCQKWHCLRNADCVSRCFGG
jgi:hypothetical protein